MEQKRILILTTSYGEGHKIAAVNLQREIKRQDETVDVQVIDIYHEAHPRINQLIKKMYIKCYSHFPRLYGDIYHVTKKIFKKPNIKNVIGLFGYNKLKEYVNTIQPDLVINTFPVLTTSLLNKREKTNIPYYVVITDYAVHSMWVDSDTEKYFIGSDCVKEKLVNEGISEQKIQTTGIPVYIEGIESQKREQLLEKYGLCKKDMPIITLFAGSYGFLRNFEKMAKCLYDLQPKAQYIFVCGRNKQLKEKTQITCEKYKDRMKVFGFVDSLYEIMSISDIFVSKPGGLATTETLNIGVPMIVFGSPPGQEYENLEFLLNNGCSCHAKDGEALEETIKDLLLHPEKLEQMRENIKLIAKPTGCSDIAKCIVDELYQKGRPMNKKALQN